MRADVRNRFVLFVTSWLNSEFGAKVAAKD